MTHPALALTLLIAAFAAIPPAYRVTDSGLELVGVSADCPIIYDNDFWTDVPDAAYLWAKASAGKCRLRGNIITRCTYGWETGYVHTLDQQQDEARKLLNAARESSLKHIPDPVIGAKLALRRPASERIEDTTFEPSAGSALIVSEAGKATPKQPLLIFVGGSCTTVATAYLSDPSIADRVLVFQIDGGGYNGSDAWAWQIAQTRLRFANWARGYFWPDISQWNPAVFDALPQNPLNNLLRDYAHGDLAKSNQWGDGAWIYWLFDHRCLTNAEDYDKSAITVPRNATHPVRMADEFLNTLNDPAVTHE